MRPKANPTGHPRKSKAVQPAPSENLNPLPPIPPVPARLGPRGRQTWEDLWEAAGAGYFPPTDRFLVERYCLLQDRHADLLSTLEAEGFLTEGSQGQQVLHPAARALDTTEKELRAMEDRLGLNPEARVRLGLASVEHKSKLDAFLKD